MQNITSTPGLRNTIELLEAEHTVKGQRLKEQLHLVCESFKPVNLPKKNIHDIYSSPYLIENVLFTAISIASGFLSGKMFTGLTANVVSKLLGPILQSGVAKVAAQKPRSIRSFGQIILKHPQLKRITNSKKL